MMLFDRCSQESMLNSLYSSDWLDTCDVWLMRTGLEEEQSPLIGGINFAVSQTC